jgi:hypothetical protein
LLIRLRFVLHPLSRTRFFITNANPACSCVYICKFQFRPIHPPSRRLSTGKCVWVFLEVKTMPREREAQWWMSVKMFYFSLWGKPSKYSLSLKKEKSDFNSTIPSMYCIGLSLYGQDGLAEYLGPVWFSFFLTSFSENLAVGRIWLCRESEYH